MARKRHYSHQKKQSVSSRLRESRGMERKLRGPVRKHQMEEEMYEHPQEDAINYGYKKHHLERSPNKNMRHHSHLMNMDHEGRDEVLLHDYYSGLAGRRRMEHEGSDMIHEDPREIANLPQEVMMKEYPRVKYPMYHLDDTERVIDNQVDEDVEDADEKVSQRYPEKY